MKSITKLYQQIKKPFRLFLLIIGLFLFFQRPIEKLINILFVEHLFSKVTSIWYNDIIVLCLFFYAICLIKAKFRKYTPSSHFILIYIIISVIYLLYRLTGTVYEFIGFYYFPELKYTDLIFLISTLQAIFLIQPKESDIVLSNNRLHNDQPLGKNGIDKYGYEEYAKEIAVKIRISNFESAFAIGINGKWGYGKTSLIDLIKRNLTEGDIIRIDFNAWNNQSPDAIIKDFFETIQEGISPYHSSVSRLMIKYSNKLVKLNNNKFTESIQATVSAVTGLDSINSLHSDINAALRDVNKKIIVFIDDLDRLDAQEINEVIRLIRNTANFYNTYFIVAYDRNYIVSALKTQNPYITPEFLEKIFQLEITLPLFNNEVIKKELSKRLKSQLPIQIHNDIDKYIFGGNFEIIVPLKGWIENMRDLTRFVNLLSLDIVGLYGEVDFIDFFRIELLKLKYPNIHNLLTCRTYEFLKAENKRGGKIFTYHLINVGVENQSNSSSITQFESYLNENYSAMFIAKNEIENIVELVDDIFQGSRQLIHHSRSHLSVIYPSKFMRYFALSLFDGTLSEIEFSRARDLEFEGFISMIDKWVSEGLYNHLQERFREIKDYDSREDFEKVIKAIFYLANRKRKDNTTNRWEVFGYDEDDLSDKIDNYNNKIVSRFYPYSDGLEVFKAFISDLFRNSNSPYTFESKFLRFLNRERSDSNFVLSKNELYELSISYLRKYSFEINKIDAYFISLFYRCEQSELEPTNRSTFVRKETMSREAKQIFIDFAFKNDLDGLILLFIKAEPWDKELFKISSFALILFDSWENLKTTMEQQKDKSNNIYLEEFLRFYAAFAVSDFGKYVPFVFEVIPRDKITRE